MKNVFVDLQEYLRAIDKKGRLLIGKSLFFAVLIYIYRAQSDEFLLMGLAGAFIVIFSFPFLSILFLWFIAHLFLALRYIIQEKKYKNIATLSVLLIVMAFLLPVPLLREHSLYLSHKEEYMTLVRLAQSDQLSHNDHCKHSLAAPEEYKKLTGDCIFVNEKGNIVEFKPYTYLVTLSYVEVPSDIFKSSTCYKNGYIWKEINQNWYVCKRYFD
jgi:succinate dehydrogenase/fumarate reductase cytochrome b subunit